MTSATGGYLGGGKVDKNWQKLYENEGIWGPNFQKSEISCVDHCDNVRFHTLAEFKTGFIKNHKNGNNDPCLSPKNHPQSYTK